MSNKSFTLIEVLAAIFLITVGVMAALIVINQTTAFTQVTSSKLVASYLAQEGIEIVKNIRDTNFLKIHKGVGGISWNSGLPSGTYYNFDYRSEAVPDDSNCPGKNYLKFESNFYKCSATANSQKLQRKITLTPDGSDILKVSVEVSWQERGREHQVIAQENLYKWLY